MVSSRTCEVEQRPEALLEERCQVLRGEMDAIRAQTLPEQRHFHRHGLAVVCRAGMKINIQGPDDAHAAFMTSIKIPL